MIQRPSSHAEKKSGGGEADGRRYPACASSGPRHAAHEGGAICASRTASVVSSCSSPANGEPPEMPDEIGPGAFRSNGTSLGEIAESRTDSAARERRRWRPTGVLMTEKARVHYTAVYQARAATKVTARSNREACSQLTPRRLVFGLIVRMRRPAWRRTRPKRICNCCIVGPPRSRLFNRPTICRHRGASVGFRLLPVRRPTRWWGSRDHSEWFCPCCPMQRHARREKWHICRDGSFFALLKLPARSRL